MFAGGYLCYRNEKYMGCLDLYTKVERLKFHTQQLQSVKSIFRFVVNIFNLRHVTIHLSLQRIIKILHIATHIIRNQNRHGILFLLALQYFQICVAYFFLMVAHKTNV